MNLLERFTNLPTSWQWVAGIGFLAVIVGICMLLLVIDSIVQGRQDRANTDDQPTAPLARVDVPKLKLAAGYHDTTVEFAKAPDPWADAENPWTTFTPGGES